jgi:hypothetical protein
MEEEVLEVGEEVQEVLGLYKLYSLATVRTEAIGGQ